MHVREQGLDHRDNVLAPPRIDAEHRQYQAPLAEYLVIRLERQIRAFVDMGDADDHATIGDRFLEKIDIIFEIGGRVGRGMVDQDEDADGTFGQAAAHEIGLPLAGRAEDQQATAMVELARAVIQQLPNLLAI